MNTFILIIAALCSQTGPGHGKTDEYVGLLQSNKIRQDAFAAQSACTKRLFKACTTTHKITGTLLQKEATCLVENL